MRPRPVGVVGFPQDGPSVQAAACLPLRAVLDTGPVRLLTAAPSMGRERALYPQGIYRGRMYAVGQEGT